LLGLAKGSLLNLTGSFLLGLSDVFFFTDGFLLGLVGFLLGLADCFLRGLEDDLRLELVEGFLLSLEDGLFFFQGPSSD
jgi:hypothetical protein